MVLGLSFLAYDFNQLFLFLEVLVLAFPNCML